MSLQIVNTGNYNDLFDDLNTVLGTNLAWAVFDNVSVDEQVFTIPPTTSGHSPAANPSFLRLFRDNTLFKTVLTIFDSWNATTHVGTNPVPTADSSKNSFDFNSAIATVSYRLYGDAVEGYVALTHNNSGGNLIGSPAFLWIGVLIGRDTPANHPNPNAIVLKTAGSVRVGNDFLNKGLAVKVENDAEVFGFQDWTNSTEQHSGKSPIVSHFVVFSASGDVGEIPGQAKDLFQCSGNLTFGDSITIGADTFRASFGGGLCIKE